MIKKILISLTILLLCGSCSHILINDKPTPVEYVTKLVELGISQEAAEVADKFSDETKDLILNNAKEGLQEVLLSTNNEDIVLYFVNNDVNADDFIRFISEKFFMLKNYDLYIKYKDNFTDTRSLIEWVNVKGYKNPYEEYELTNINDDILMLANKIYYLNDYVPTDLVEVEDSYCMQKGNSLRKEAYEAYKQMADDARKENLDFNISTSYRSYKFQDKLYKQYLEQYKDEKIVDTFSSRPGFSDHQTGLAVDIRNKDKTFDDMKNTDEIKWLNDNSYKYGFILRYPEGKENITGYEYEWWHFRYVGKDVAKIIYDNKITFDEYYAYYIEK